ncbi:MAG: hypothetical protein ACRBB3_09915 [Alphaproteobacteria bacterium]
MSYSKTMAAILFMAATYPAQAQEATINVIDRTTQGKPIIVIQSLFNFEQDISLKLNTDTNFDISDILIETISKFYMVNANGIIIKSGFDIDTHNNLVLAFSGGTSEIIRTNPLPNGFQVIGSFKDAKGNFVSPPLSSIALYNTNGEKLCFDYESITQSPPKMAFTILIDKSYSMVDEFADVKKTASEFLNILPSSALCAVASFDVNWEYTHKGYQYCSAEHFEIDAIQIGTATDIYAPLKDAYLKLSRPHFSGYQKAVIIITDGHMVADPVRKQELLSLKGDTHTFVYFIGGTQRAHLEGITNQFLEQRGNIKNSLSRYFGAIGKAYNSQKVINIRKCQGVKHAKP